MEKLKGCTYKITHMSVASYPILKLKPRTNFDHSLYIHHRSQLLFGTMVGSPRYMSAEI